MENMEKRYTLYLKIGDDELSVSGEEAGYIREMLEEFKYLHSGKVRVAPSAEPGPRAKKARPGLVAEAGFTELYKKVRPRKGLDKALLYLYYLHQKGETRGVRPREVAKAIAGTGEKAPKAISTSLGYMKRLGLVNMKDRFWSITSKGVDRVEKKLIR
jgi:hypothetical protein